jgi:hypothetical protein
MTASRRLFFLSGASVFVSVAVVLAAGGPAVQASAQDHHGRVMKRGAEVMGFDQATTTHHFRLRANGGIIEVTANDPADTAAIAQIRSHLQHIARMFADGNFSAPMLVHARQPPGVAEMKRAGASIGYRYEEIDRGARIHLETMTAAAPVQEFLRFQITDHQTGDPLTVEASKDER